MAALRYGIRTEIIPKDNERDLEEIAQNVRNALNFVIAQNVDTVLQTALNPKEDVVPKILQDIPGEVTQKARKPAIRQ